MPFNISYELAAYIMRYVFLALTIGILCALISVSYHETKDKKDIKGILSAFSGYLEIIEGPVDFLGDQFGVAAENIIGSEQDADIIIEGAGVWPRHARLWASGSAFYIEPVNGAEVFVNNNAIAAPRALKTGDVVGVGDIDLILRLKRKRITYDA